MAKYEIYQTQVETHNSWIKLIPKEWQAVPLKYMCNGFVKDGPHETPKFIDEGIPFLSVDGIQNNKLVFEGCRYISIEDDARFSLKCKPQKGNILLGKAASVGKVAFVEDDYNFNVWSPLAVISPKDIRLGKFIFYCLQSYELQLQCDVFSNSNTQKNLGMTTIDNLTLPYPSISEAENIANFLDHETAQIDALIAKQEKLIELLKEKRQAVISHAVTKGLNPDVNMKDSGVEWLGQVPEHWEKKILKYIVSQQGGGTPDKSNLAFWDGEIPWVSPKDMKVDYISTSQDKITVKAIEQSATKLVPIGSVLMVVRGMILIHSVPVALTQEAVTINQDMKALIPNKMLDSEYFLYLLKGLKDYLLDYVETSGHGTKCLRSDDFMNMPLFLPNVEEQKNIVEYIKNKSEIFDSLTQKVESAIQLMQVRRTALISSAVTGKIDVRHWQNPNKNNDAKTELDA